MVIQNNELVPVVVLELLFDVTHLSTWQSTDHLDWTKVMDTKAYAFLAQMWALT